MQAKGVKAFFDGECLYYGHDHDPETYQVWRDVLGGYEERELKRALSIWHADDTEISSFGAVRARGSFFPKASDLRGIIERGKAAERDEAVQFQPCNRSLRNVDVNGTSWPELVCSSGQLYLRTTDGAGNSALRSMRNCDCYLRWKAERVA